VPSGEDAAIGAFGYTAKLLSKSMNLCAATDCDSAANGAVIPIIPIEIPITNTNRKLLKEHTFHFFSNLQSSNDFRLLLSKLKQKNISY
jgi:hypothetical protein